MSNNIRASDATASTDEAPIIPCPKPQKNSEESFFDTVALLTSTYIAEDHGLRSRCMRHLIQEAGALLRPETRSFDRLLVQFWNDAKAIPADVKECVDSWQLLDGQGFERVLFDDDSAARFISERFGDRYLAAFERCMHPAMRADYFRLCFIMLKGGIYVDADDVYQGGDMAPLLGDGRLILQPLCYEISSDSMVDPVALSPGSSETPDLIFYINNNPLIAPPNHPVISMALERSTRILLAHSDAPTDVQSTTGPGNLTACLVQHVIESKRTGAEQDFLLLPSWGETAISRWPLEYRRDKRNWRLWDGRNFLS